MCNSAERIVALKLSESMVSTLLLVSVPLEPMNETTSDPHQRRTTQVDPPPTHGIVIPAAEVESKVLYEGPINQAKLPLTYPGRRRARRRRKRGAGRPETTD